MDEEVAKDRSTGAKVLLISLGILFLLPGACGGLFFGAMLADWLGNAFTFRSGGLNLGPGITGMSAVSLMASIFLLGVLFRRSKWSHGPAVSLWLAILAVLVVFAAYVMLAPTILEEDTESRFYLLAASLAGLGLVALPAYLYWRGNRKS